MVTTTTKTLNYSITKGNQTNSVNATITSTPGFNSNYLGKLPGILHFLELLLAAISFGLIIALRKESRVRLRVEGTPAGNEELSYLHELLLIGDVYFISAHSAVLTFLIILLIAYLFHTTTAMIIPKATTLENVAHLVLALLLLAAGILQIVMTVNWKWEDNSPNARRLIFDGEFGQRLAAGAIAILNAILFIVSLVMSRKELAGPKAL